MSSSTAPGEARGAQWLRVGAGLLALVAYQAVVHWAVTRASGSVGAALVALGPPAAALVWVGWHRSPASGLTAGLAAAGVLALAAGVPGVARALPLVLQLVVCLALAWMFGRTLRHDREPLLTRLARGVHGTLPPAIVAYTRNITLMWTLFLLAASVTSVLLFAFAPLRVWSLFANLLLLPAVVLMFLGEYLYRHLRYPWFAHATIAQSLGAFARRRSAPPAGPGTRC